MNSFDQLAKEVRSAGLWALEQQSKIHRMYKDDGTVLTETDLAVTERIINAIKRIFVSDFNIVTEEIDLKSFRGDAQYTFILDPIDGTDSYSQGLPAWCVALGVLDHNRKPVSGMVSAPRFGVGTSELFVQTNPDSSEIYLNDRLFTPWPSKDHVQQLMLGSNAIKEIDISAYKGKIRSYGSSILHMLCPVIFSNISADINPTCYAWDIAASHAILLKGGMDISYVDGTAFEYTDDILIRRKKYRMPLVVGTKAAREELLSLIKVY